MCFIYELITVFIEYWFDNLSWDGQKAIIDLCDFKDEEFAYYYTFFLLDVWVSLCVFELILWVLKLMTM